MVENRRCEQCNGTVPNRMSRQRNDKGQLVCEECIRMSTPSWTAGLRYAESMGAAPEMRRRIAEALASIARVRRTGGLSVVAHDSGDNAIINHCPFCGSGAVLGGSDGSVSCDFCHSSFTVQVQPAHPFMPQTVDGQPVPPAGMPGEEPTEMSAPLDPAVNETDEGVVDPTDPTGQEATPNEEPKGKVPPQFAKGSAKMADFNYNPTPVQNPLPVETCPHDGWDAVKSIGPGRYELYRCSGCAGRFRIYDTMTEEWGEPAWHPGAAKPPTGTTAAYRTADGHTLDEQAYMARLALAYADDKNEVIDAVRHLNLQRQAIQNNDPNSREDHPYPDMGNMVVYTQAVRQFINAGLFPNFAEADKVLRDRLLPIPGIQSNLTTTERIAEVMAELGGTKQADLLRHHDDPTYYRDSGDLLAQYPESVEDDLLDPDESHWDRGYDLLADQRAYGHPPTWRLLDHIKG